MRYAIDRFVAGKEKEVAASEFYGKYYIPRRHSRFFCPECNEPVYWRSRGGSNPDVFYHKEKTDQSPECDKRVDGRSELSLSQRVGLPLFLSQESGMIYKLNLAFPSLGTQLFEKLYSDQTVVRISAGSTKEKTIHVNPTNFYKDETTLIPLDFFPDYGRNYKISVSTSKWSYSLNKRWSDYADGFDSQGGVFNYSETGGKKVRRGDSIAIGQKYYLISKQYSSPYPEIVTKRVGSIYLNRQDYSVYEMVVNASTGDESRFNIINNYLKCAFGIWLLEKVPKLIPLWPPVVERDTLSPTTQSGSVYCAVVSGNEAPKVFSYTASGTSELKIKQNDGYRTVAIPTREDIAVSVDRKYVGRELNFSKAQERISVVEAKISIADSNGDVLNGENISSKILEPGFEVSSNLKAELYVQSYDNVFQRIVIRQNQTQVPSRRHPYSLIVISEGVILKNYLVTNPDKKSGELRQLDISTLFQHNHGVFVPIPRKILPMLEANPELKIVIKNGKIQHGVLVWLLRSKEVLK